MSIMTDLWIGLPKEIKIIFGISVFLFIGSSLLQIIVWAWNFFVIGGMNLVNGCLTDAAVCVPTQQGIFIFGINFADYWTILMLIILLPIALFAMKWYSFMFGSIHQKG